ncbi:MAG: glycosyltransferase family 2 protein, partial [Actinomycetota bacterium]|nr:glycosyltransferase family 2 protein [Actinomycetota bacterium]
MNPGLVLIGWACGWLLLWRLPRLTGGRLDLVAATPVSVVIPARDEATTLPRLLASLATQQGIGPVEVLVADDGSRDGTAEVATAFGARVVTVSEPPRGWLGKPWACNSAVAEARNEQLVFLDADVVLAPGALAAVVAAHGADAPNGLLSVQPVHHVGSAYEHLSLVGNLVALLASGIGRVGRSPGRSDRIAFGPCLAVTRT